MQEFNVDDAPYSAVGDGVTDDRAAIQSAINDAEAAGGVVVLGPNTYGLGSLGGSSVWCLKIDAPIIFKGHGIGRSVLKKLSAAAGGSPSQDDVKVIYVDGADNSHIHDFSIDGNRAGQGTDEHRHGIFLLNCEHVIVERVAAYECMGDGINLFTDVNHCIVRDCQTYNNNRDGIALTGRGTGNVLDRNYVYNNVAQQIDTETGVATNTFHFTRITNNFVDVGSSNDYAVTAGGSDPDNLCNGLVVANNVINGSLRVLYASNAVVLGNTGQNETSKPSVEFYRRNVGVLVTGNAMELKSTSVATVMVDFLGTTGDYPENASCTNNAFRVLTAATGIRAQGVSQSLLNSNLILGPANGISNSTYGIIARSTLVSPDPEGRSCTAIGNYIANFGSSGLIVSGNGAARSQVFVGIGNVCDDTAATPRMLTAVTVDGNPATQAWEEFVWQGNNHIGACTIAAKATNKVTPFLTSGSKGYGSQYSFPNSKI